MQGDHVYVVYFSPTGGTARIARTLGQTLYEQIHAESMTFIDLTRPEARHKEYHFNVNEIVIVASPVYAGRLPNKIAPDYAACLHADLAFSIPVCVFGNRSPGDAVRELTFLLEENGFLTLGTAAVACHHAFTDDVGTGRPDVADEEELRQFACDLATRLDGDIPVRLPMDRETPIAPYYTPRKVDGTPARFLKAAPVRTSACQHCGRCASLCPMGSIDAETLEMRGICIKCQACIRGCPRQARIFTDEDFLSHVEMLRQNYTRRAENQFYMGNPNSL